MKKVHIYQPSKTAMQSGKAKIKYWILEFDPENTIYHDPLMGWIGTHDNKNQIHLKFETLEEAIAYAEKNRLPYEISKPHLAEMRPKSYADNFKAKE